MSAHDTRNMKDDVSSIFSHLNFFLVVFSFLFPSFMDGYNAGDGMDFLEHILYLYFNPCHDYWLR